MGGYNPAETLLLFTIGPVGFSLPATAIERTIFPPNNASQPSANGTGRAGLFRHADKIYTLIDLRQRLGLGRGEGGRLLLCHHGGRHLALHVDEIVGLARGEQGEWKPLPVNLPRNLFYSAFQFHDRIFLCSELATLLSLRDDGTLSHTITPPEPTDNTRGEGRGDNRDRGDARESVSNAPPVANPESHPIVPPPAPPRPTRRMGTLHRAGGVTPAPSSPSKQPAAPQRPSTTPLRRRAPTPRAQKRYPTAPTTTGSADRDRSDCHSVPEVSPANPERNDWGIFVAICVVLSLIAAVVFRGWPPDNKGRESGTESRHHAVSLDPVRYTRSAVPHHNDADPLALRPHARSTVRVERSGEGLTLYIEQVPSPGEELEMAGSPPLESVSPWVSSRENE